MLIFVLNAGSSSLKCRLMDTGAGRALAELNCERIGIDGRVKYKNDRGEDAVFDADFPDHAAAFSQVISLLTGGDNPLLHSFKEIAAVGHRIAMGGMKFTAPALIDREVMEGIAEYRDLAPLHAPPQIDTIKACEELLGKEIPQVAVFDTGFHMTMPQKAYIYPLPLKYHRRYHVRRYGFHGISHRYVSLRTAELLGRDIKDLKMVICHLGNGSSMCAVKHGESVDVTTGFGTFDGLIMGTRSGAVDPAVFFYIGKKEGLSYDQLIDLATKKSGFLGLTGLSSDHRELEKEAFIGNERAKLALEIQIYQIKKYLGAFAFAMGGLDAVVFTGGIGERAPSVRQGVCEDLEAFGIRLNKELNHTTKGVEMDLSAPDSHVKILVVPTDEEMGIAIETEKIVRGLHGPKQGGEAL